MNGGYFVSLQEYVDIYQVNEMLMWEVESGVIVLYFGLMNCDLEISIEVVDGLCSCIIWQVENG